MTNFVHQDGILSGLPADLIRAHYAAAPGNEIGSGKFLSRESSAALAANTFGFFLERSDALPPLPVADDLGWPPLSVRLEVENRFPWSGGRHPWLDVLVETSTTVIGIESKRYEPFRTKGKFELSDAYWRPVWGDAMAGYCKVRDDLRAGELQFERLDAAQLVKHAFGLRTAVHRAKGPQVKRPVLVYLYAEPASWPDDRIIPEDQIASHRQEIEAFAERVVGDEVRFIALSYQELLDAWRRTEDVTIRTHAAAIVTAFAP